MYAGFSGSSGIKNPPVNAGNTGSISALGRSSGEGNDNPFQYFCLEKPMHRRVWQVTVHEVTKRQTLLSD